MEQFASRNYRISNNKPASTRPSLENLHSMQTSSLSQQQQRATLGISPGYGSSVAYPNLEESMWQHMMGQSVQVPDTAIQRCFPERPNEPDCVYYIRTGQCAYAMDCKFNHPSNRKLAGTYIGSGKGEYPERVGQPECQYYMKTGDCKFGSTCKFHHPRDRLGRVSANILGFPLRQGEKDCQYYMQTGSCKFGATCKFNHPQPTAVKGLPTGLGSSVYPSNVSPEATLTHPFPSGIQSWSLAQPHYMPRPRFQSPSNFTPLIVQPPQNMLSLPGWNPYQARLGSMASLGVQQSTPGVGKLTYGTSASDESISPSDGIHATYNNYVQSPGATGIDPSSIEASVTSKGTMFPERPGQLNCDYYMRTGNCKYQLSCRFNHPKERASSLPNCIISPLGLPLRQGVRQCPFYMQYRTCKFGPTCKFDHPMPNLTYSPSASSLTELVGTAYPVDMAVTTANNNNIHPKPLSNGNVDNQHQDYGDSYISSNSEESNMVSNISTTTSLEMMGHQPLRDSANSNSSS